MQENKGNDFFVDLVRDVALRYAIHDEAKTQVADLYIEVTKVVNWQANMSSDKAADEVLNRLQVNGGKASMVINMTSNFMFRAGITTFAKRSELAEMLSESVSWPRDVKELGMAQARLTATAENAHATFAGNPWMMFLYLLSMTDLVPALNDLHKPKPPVPKPIP